jgi:hypothetical protein
VITTTTKYEFVYPRSLQVVSIVFIDTWPRRITRINADHVLVTVYFPRTRKRGIGQREDSDTYGVEGGEVRARKLVQP